MNSSSTFRNFELVQSFTALVETSFHDQVNAFGWKRELVGDFEEIVNKLTLNDAITEIAMEQLNALDLSPAGQQARAIICEDYQQLTDFGAQPTLNLLQEYERDDTFDFISTDVYSYHVDRSPIATDTFLCTYYGTSSDIIPNEEVIQKILIPSVREQLFALYNGPTDGFESFLKDYYFDLHYQALPHAQPINLGQGNIWRLAVDHPAQQVLPCVHRAPKEGTNELRLLLIC